MRTILLAFFALFLGTLFAKPGMVHVKFQDGEGFFANLLEKKEGSIRVEFLHTHSIYEFDRNGYILASSGKYRPGTRVKAILIYPHQESLYARESMSSTSGDGGSVGVVFGDSKVYYGVLQNGGDAGWCSIYFFHSRNTYTLNKTNNTWKVHSTDKGSYPAGTTILDIFSIPMDGENYFVAP